MDNSELFDKISLLKEFGIDIESNRFLLGKDYNELTGKINYLIENNLPIQIDGKLNSIFWLSYKKIEKKYGITKQELLGSDKKLTKRLN